ncbi:MAG: RsmF rRNA methyltransferase first C-terminal domain-containing protein, partial [Lachnospiraceae bacterium]|nr:RsmF rRNA methyltransferase first C-terminal domain-containing protein [Lachnospiraceae bacterium]
IPFLRNGLYLGEIKKNRFEPSQSFAMALKGPAMVSGSREKSLGEDEGLGEYASYVNFDYSDERVRRYLCGETVEVDDLSPARPKGWQLVCVNGYPLGWGKLVNGTLKNKYHPGWRMQV